MVGPHTHDWMVYRTAHNLICDPYLKLTETLHNDKSQHLKQAPSGRCQGLFRRMNIKASVKCRSCMTLPRYSLRPCTAP